MIIYTIITNDKILNYTHTFYLEIIDLPKLYGYLLI